MADLRTELSRAFEEDALFAVRAGNILDPVRRYIPAFEGAGQLERRQLYTRLLGVLRACCFPLTATERRKLSELVDAIREESTALSGERDALRKLVSKIPMLPETAPPGTVTVLLAGEYPISGEPLGATQQLVVRVDPWGGKVGLNFPAGRDQLYYGFRQGVSAAQQWVMAKDPRKLDGAILAQSHSAGGSFPHLNQELPVDGESLGLASAIAMISGMLGIPVKTDLAFTGKVDANGTVHPVSHVTEKVGVAVDKGLRELLLPAMNVSDLPVEARGIASPVETVAEAVRRTFDPEMLEAALENYLQSAVPAAFRSRSVGSLPGKGSGIVLLSWVGKSDPVGNQLGKNREVVGQEEGPLLACVRELRPAAVHLLYTVEKGENDFRGKAGEVERLLREYSEGGDVILVPVDGLEDPSDYVVLIPRVREAVERILSQYEGRNIDIFVNLSSGAPQMETAWHLLKERGILSGAHLVQAREGRYAKNGLRVRLMDLPAL